METKRSAHRNAELWVEFENKTRLHIAMFEKIDPDESLIPSLGSDMHVANVPSIKLSKVMVNESVNSLKIKETDEDQHSIMAGSRMPTALSGKTTESPIR